MYILITDDNGSLIEGMCDYFEAKDEMLQHLYVFLQAKIALLAVMMNWSLVYFKCNWH